jgi:hypothetical protein
MNRSPSLLANGSNGSPFRTWITDRVTLAVSGDHEWRRISSEFDKCLVIPNKCKFRLAEQNNSVELGAA